MAIPKLRGTFKLPNPRSRTQRTDLALRAKNRPVVKKFDHTLYRNEVFPTQRNYLRNIPEEYLLISMAQRFRRQQGFVKPKLLVGLVGAAGGFLAGSAFQFSQLKEYIAKAAGLDLEQLSYCDFLANPGMSVKDYASVVAAGAVGLFIGVGLGWFIGSQMESPNNRQRNTPKPSTGRTVRPEDDTDPMIQLAAPARLGKFPKGAVPLSEFGEVRHIECEGQKYELIMGLEATPEITRILGQLNIRAAANSSGVLSLSEEEIYKVMITINDGTGAMIGLPNNDASFAIAQEYGALLAAKGIGCFMMAPDRPAGEPLYIPPMVDPSSFSVMPFWLSVHAKSKTDYAMVFEPSQRMANTGVILGRLIPKDEG